MYIYSNNNSISKELCADIIELFEKEDDKYEGITMSGLNKTIKDTIDFIIPKNSEKWNKISSFLSDELTRNVSTYLKKLYDNINTNLSFFKDKETTIQHFQIQRYTANVGKYIYHNDADIDIQENKYRIITFLWYLNTVNEGGETEFNGDFLVKPEVGKLILFPATWTFPHCGRIPISNDKYILTGWIYANIN
jgi:hypothetical protein